MEFGGLLKIFNAQGINRTGSSQYGIGKDKIIRDERLKKKKKDKKSLKK